MASYSEDGNDVEAVRTIATTAVDLARQGNGPQFIELHTYRWREHCGPNFDDDLNYRCEAEIEHGLNDCPIARFTAELKQSIPNIDAEVERLEAEIREEIALAFDFALASPKLTTADAGTGIYA